MNLFSVKNIKEELKKIEASPQKWLGQNFLVCEQAANKLVSSAQLSPEEIVVEIGPGLGSITKKLMEKEVQVVAIEKDRRLAEYLKKKFRKDNIRIIRGDALESSEMDKIKKYKVVANLPFNISKEVLRRFLEKDNQPELMSLVFQKEVAQSMVSQPPHMDLLGVAVQIYAQPEIVSSIPRNCFWPQPEVEAAVVKISNIRKPKIKEGEFFKLVRGGFAHRRKYLVNSLIQELEIDKRKIEKGLRKINLSKKVRAENLSVEEWMGLTNNLC